MAHQTLEPGESVLSDEEVLRKAKNAENGQIFRALFEDGWNSQRVRRMYERPRAAEFALVVRLTWWTRQELSQVHRLFRKSAFHRADLDYYPDYFQELAQSALKLLGKECYDPDYGRREDS